jgi:hypothetical protein
LENPQYRQGYRFGRRDGRYAQLFGSVPFVGTSVEDVRRWARANSHKTDGRADRAYWLGYARGLTA